MKKVFLTAFILLVLLAVQTASFAGDKAWTFTRFIDTPYPAHNGTKGGDLAVADFNGDGRPDILVTGMSNAKYVTFIYLYTEKGYVLFKDHKLPGLDVGTHAAVADMDGDGIADLVVYGRTSVAMQTSMFRVYKNNGKAVFAEMADLGKVLPIEDFEDVKGSWSGDDSKVLGVYDSLGFSSGGLNVADLNGDGRPDIVFAGSKGMESGQDPAAQTVQRDWETSGVFLNNGGGKFTYLTSGKQGPDYSFPGIAKVTRCATAAADFNNDGKIDLVLFGQANRGNLANPGIPETQRNGKPVGEAYLGKGDGTFARVENPGLPALIDGTVCVADLNGDKKPDLVVAGNTGNPGDPQGGRYTRILLGKGDGTFAEDETQAYGYKPNDLRHIRAVMSGDIAVGDLDLDGDLDLVIAGNDNDRSLRIYENDKGVFVQKELTKAKNGIGTNAKNGTASSDAVSECNLALTDIDGDGDPDLIVNGRGGSMQLLVFKNLVK